MKHLHGLAFATVLSLVILVLFYNKHGILSISKTGRWQERYLPKRNVHIKVGIDLADKQGLTEFTASVLRRYHHIDAQDITVYTSSKTELNYPQLAQWYGTDMTITSTGNMFPALRKVIREFVDQSIYKALLLIDSNMIFHPHLKDVIIRHMLDRKNPMPFLSLYHSSDNHSYVNDCENLVENDLCEGSLQSKLGVAISQEFAKKILRKHLHALDNYNWVDILREENLPLLYPKKSLIVKIQQINQTEDQCGENFVPYGFQFCDLPVWVRDGLEWYMDRCTNSKERYIPGISIEKANRENRMWTRPAISYALYGDSTRYTDGALENSRRVYSIYPGWKIWIYLDNTVPKAIVDSLCEQNVKFIDMAGTDVVNKMSWRFLIASEPVPMYAIRDIDSRLLSRGKAAVDEWIDSGRKFHVMRDHPNHARHPINGGMWGGSVAIPNMRSLINRYRGQDTYMTDMNFLRNQVWEIVGKSVWAHDSHSLNMFGEDHPFPTAQRSPDEFVGNVDFS